MTITRWKDPLNIHAKNDKIKWGWRDDSVAKSTQEDLSLLPSTHSGPQSLIIPVPWGRLLPSDLQEHKHVHGAFRCTQANTHIKYK